MADMPVKGSLRTTFLDHLGRHSGMWSSTFRVNSIKCTPLGLLFRGGQGTRDRGQWELLEVTDTTSNTLDSIGYTPLGLIFRGGQETGDRGQWELLEARATT